MSMSSVQRAMNTSFESTSNPFRLYLFETVRPIFPLSPYLTAFLSSSSTHVLPVLRVAGTYSEHTIRVLN
jgi:hypothetical protein